MPGKPLSANEWAIRINGAAHRCDEITVRQRVLEQDFSEYQKAFSSFRKEIHKMVVWERSLVRRANRINNDLRALKSRFTLVAEKLEIGAALLGTYEDLDAIDKVLKRRKTKLRVRRHRQAMKSKKEDNAAV